MRKVVRTFGVPLVAFSFSSTNRQIFHLIFQFINNDLMTLYEMNRWNSRSTRKNRCQKLWRKLPQRKQSSNWMSQHSQSIFNFTFAFELKHQIKIVLDFSISKFSLSHFIHCELWLSGVKEISRWLPKLLFILINFHFINDFSHAAQRHRPLFSSVWKWLQCIPVDLI